MSSLTSEGNMITTKTVVYRYLRKQGIENSLAYKMAAELQKLIEETQGTSQ